MPRYFFHIHECGPVFKDEEGVELQDLEAARAQAVIGARELMCEEMKNGRLCLGCLIEVQDEAGQVVLTVPFTEAVAVTGI